MSSGETIATGASDVCPDCGDRMKIAVYQSNAGYYVGTYSCSGPYSRESGYYRTYDEAQAVLETNSYSR